MKMLPRIGPVVEPAFKENSGPIEENGRIVTRSVQITVEREVLSVLLHQPGGSFAGLCAECGREVMLLTVATAAQLTGATPRAIYRWVENAAMHFQEDAAGNVFVCSESLPRAGRLDAGTDAGAGSARPLAP
jgi:hypothetical protein